MTRKRFAHGYRQSPRGGTVQRPMGNSGKINMRISQGSMEQGISVSNRLEDRHMKLRSKAYKFNFLVQPKHPIQNKHSLFVSNEE